MATEFARDNPQDSTYQAPDCRARNRRLSELINTIWNPFCIQRIDRSDQAPDTFGWTVTY